METEFATPHLVVTSKEVRWYKVLSLVTAGLFADTFGANATVHKINFDGAFFIRVIN